MNPPPSPSQGTTKMLQRALSGAAPAVDQPPGEAVAQGTTRMLQRALSGVALAGDQPPRDVAPNAAELVSKALPVRRFPVDFAGYRLLRPLGSGGMAEVFEATHLRLKRQVAFKVLKPAAAQDPEFPRRFLRESRVMAQISHPHVVAIYEAGTVDGCLFMAQELLTGGDLARLLARRGHLELDETLLLMIGCAAGLEAIHAAGLVHRDIKPANIFLDAQGQPKLGDLGLARGAAGDDRLTVNGSCWGTPSYMSPEQITGSADIDIRSDIYALGATLYTLLVGSEPYSGETSYIITFKAMTEAVPDPRKFNRMIPAEVVTIIHRAMDKNRELRFATPRALREALERARQRLQQGLTATDDQNHATAVGENKSFGPAAERIQVARSGQVERRISQRRPLPRVVIQTGVFAVLVTAVGGVYGSLIGGGTAGTSAVSSAPAWASAWGQDRIGAWADLTIADVTRRLRYCPPSRYDMGSNPTETGHQAWENQHRVTLSTGFWMLTTECDQVLYHTVVGSNPSRIRGDDLPVDSLSRRAAQDFCVALTKRGVLARLPTEAEWEYACRAGETGPYALVPAARQVGWMAVGPLLAVWDGAGPDVTTGAAAAERFLTQHLDEMSLGSRPVAQLPANHFGLFDLHGNLAEWCADNWDGHHRYEDSAQVDPLSHAGHLAIVRGGSWFTPAKLARSAARAGYDPADALPFVGFRFVIPQQ